MGGGGKWGLVTHEALTGADDVDEKPEGVEHRGHVEARHAQERRGHADN